MILCFVQHISGLTLALTIEHGVASFLEKNIWKMKTFHLLIGYAAYIIGKFSAAWGAATGKYKKF